MVARPDDSLTHAAREMAREKVGSLLIVDGGSLVGVLTTTNVVEHCARVFGRTAAMGN
jgi:CBS domain-containing protein